MHWLYLAGAIAGEVVATSMLRAASEPGAHWTWWIGVVSGYLSAFGLLYASMSSGMPLSIAYAIWAGLGVAATAMVAWLIFHEQQSLWSLAGIAVVVVGVVMIELGSGTSMEAA
jgi:small multidrug resistance pump